VFEDRGDESRAILTLGDVALHVDRVRRRAREFRSPASTLRTELKTTWSPSFAKRSAVASPMPLRRPGHQDDALGHAISVAVATSRPSVDPARAPRRPCHCGSASGGQVIGSTATAVRRRPLSRLVAGEDLGDTGSCDRHSTRSHRQSNRQGPRWRVRNRHAPVR